MYRFITVGYTRGEALLYGLFLRLTLVDILYGTFL